MNLKEHCEWIGEAHDYCYSEKCGETKKQVDPNDLFNKYLSLNKSDQESLEKKIRIHKKGNKALFTSNKENWLSPEKIMNLTYEFMDIHTDPCSNSDIPSEANVNASTYFTKETNGLDKEWVGNVFMNPPYGRTIKKWVEKCLSEFELHRLSEPDYLLLLPARTDTQWYRLLKDHSFCLIDGRLKFIDGDIGEAVTSATFPSVIVLMTTLESRKVEFESIFKDVGRVYLK